MMGYIRSFVRRQGRMTSKQQNALEQYWSKYGLELTNGTLDYQQVFGRHAPRVLEIGFGMGYSLATMAESSPDEDYIGIEVHKPGVGALLVECHERTINNIRVYQDDAMMVLDQCIPDNSLHRIQLFFPDPWPKKRHHKRRIVRSAFVNLLKSKLEVGGILHIVTDWQDYAEHIVNVLAEFPELNNQSCRGDFSNKPDYRPITKYEQRAQRLGHHVYELMFKRVN